MIELVKDFPNQLKHALKLAKNVKVVNGEDDILNIVVVGMGGSGIGGSIVYSIVRDEILVPYSVVKGYDLPNFVNSTSLVICSSFSGNTEETLSAYHQAKDRGAKVCVISSGGEISELAKNNNDDLIVLPNEISSPRANLGYSVVHLLCALNKYDLISDSYLMEVENLIFLLENNKSNISDKAKEIAMSMKDRMTFLYSGERVEATLLRNTQQINENGKQICHYNTFPELNHNEIVGWQHPSVVFENAVFIFFETDFDHSRVRKRIEISKGILNQNHARIIELKAKGTSFLEQIFYIINLFDFVSCELADNNKVDPNTIASIDFLKGELAKVQ